MIDKNHPPIDYGKTGVVIVNLGTPDSTSWFDIRKYLREFLSDRRVIEVNPFLWKIILNLFILNFRPSKTAEAYKKIIIDYAMRYGDPSINSKMRNLQSEGCENIVT